MHNHQPSSDYERWVARLYGTPLFDPSSRPTLDHMNKLYKILGYPLDNPNIDVVHVAGTNGKGSVCLKIAKTLEKLNCYHVVGLYSSPHTSCFRERIQIDGQLVSEKETGEQLARIYQLCRHHNIPATFFEIATSLAFMVFEGHHRKNNPGEAKKSAVVLEVGLGGRLDATNVVAPPALAIITSIGLDHTAILGKTIDKIAIEKAGIMKAGIPVLVGRSTPENTLRQQARKVGVSDFWTCEELLGLNGGNGSTHDLDYDAENTRLALAAISILQKLNLLPATIPSAILAETSSIRPSCRFEIIEKERTVILDVAHNPSAMQSLLQKLVKDRLYRVVLGLSKDKDWQGILSILFPQSGQNINISKLHLVQASHPKASPLIQLVHDIKASNLVPAHHDVLEYDLDNPSVSLQLQRAMEQANPSETILVCGSVFLMAETRKALEIDEPRDSDFLVAIDSGVTPNSLAFGNDEELIRNKT